jgi:hypothetical protein
MQTSSFESRFIEALKRRVETSHSGLKISVPSAGAQTVKRGFSFTPDALVENERTGDVLVVEVKGGTSSNTVPYAFISKLKSWRHGVDKKPVGILLVSSARVPPAMLSMLRAEEVFVAEADSVEEAISAIDSKLTDLESL